MDTTEIKRNLCIAFVSDGILPTDFEATAKKIAEAAPTEVKEKLNNNTWAIASEYYAQYKALLDQKHKDGNEKIKIQDHVAKPELSAEQLQAINEVTKNLTSKFDKAEKTTIIKLITNMPLQSTYLKPAKVVPFSHLINVNAKSEIAKKLANWEKMLVREGDKGEENIANFNMIKEAYEKNQPLPIRINNDRKKRTTIGCRITTPAANGGLEEKLLATKGLVGFVALELGGYIPNRGANTVGCQIRTAKTKLKAGGVEVGKVETPTLRFYNKAACMEIDNMVESASVVKTDKKGAVVTKKELTPVTIDCPFQIYAFDVKPDGSIVAKVNNKGVKIVKTITVKGGLKDYPEFVRADDKMKDVFGRTSTENQFAAAPTQKDLPEFRQTINKALQFLTNRTNAEAYGATAFAEGQAALAGSGAGYSDL